MTQIIESVAIENDQVDNHNANYCPFCAKNKTGSDKNHLKNSSSQLRAACHCEDCLGLPEPCSNAAGAKQWRVVYTHPGTGVQDVCEVRSNPHHCIPGRASLKGNRFEHPILEAMEKAKGTITGDIGYNVNGRENGIWLPTILENFYGGYLNVSPMAGIRWGQLTEYFPDEQFSMAEAAMYETGRQFHDAHPDYSQHVIGRLDKLFDKLVLRKLQCPDAESKSKPDVPPPYGLVQWMHSLSRGMAGNLSVEARRWRDPIFTSRHAKMLHKKLI